MQLVERHRADAGVAAGAVVGCGSSPAPIGTPSSAAQASSVRSLRHELGPARDLALEDLARARRRS